jgi:hypothetical protein
MTSEGIVAFALGAGRSGQREMRGRGGAGEGQELAKKGDAEERRPARWPRGRG